MGFEISKSGVLSSYIPELGVKTVYLPNTVKSIGKAAFKGLKGITSINIGPKVNKITVWGFIECSDLIDINVSENNKYFSSINGLLCNKDGSVLLFCPQGRSELEVPEGIVEVADYSCSRAVALKKVAFPNSLKRIGKDAFLRTSIETLVIPKNVESIAENVFNGCIKLKSAEICAKIDTISSYTFSNCNALEKINIPKGTTKIGEGAFKGCGALSSITIPSSVKYIDSYAFSECTALNDIDFQNKETIIDTYAFSKEILDELTIVKLSPEINDIQYIATPRPPIEMQITKNGVLKKVTKDYLRTRVIIPEGVKEIGANVFSKCRITEVILPESLIKIGKAAFKNCSFLKIVKFSNSVEVIGDNAFEGCDLHSIELPESIVEIGVAAFKDNISIKRLTIPPRIKKICDSTFSGCVHLSRLTLNEGIEELGACAFYECHALMNVVLPESLSVIGHWALGYLEPECGAICAYHNITLYCHTSSVGEKYAKQNNFKCRPYEEATNIDDEGIDMNTSKGQTRKIGF